MVRRLVRRRLLQPFSRPKSARAYQHWPPSLARWLLAPPHQSCPHGSAIEYSARVPIHRLRFQSRAILDHLKCSGATPRNHGLLILIKRVGAADEAVGKTAGPFRGPRATGGSMCAEARHRCRRRFPEIRPDGASPIAAAKWFRRSCQAENGGKRQRPESAPVETSSPALVPRATPIPSVRAPRRTRRNGSNPSPRASLLGSNRVTIESRGNCS